MIYVTEIDPYNKPIDNNNYRGIYWLLNAFDFFDTTIYNFQDYQCKIEEQKGHTFILYMTSYYFANA